ncbi:MAG TPA: methyltransferase domain-containing protein [Saprospiraceae bacterium]|nr:methyltransferase domain-containing protein [Saprospiraceae bacterium]
MKNYLHNKFNPEELVQVFDELPLWSAPFGLKLLEAIEYKKGITALDIGFGTGFPLTELAMRLGESSKVFGIDPWTSAIDRTKRKISFYSIQNITLIEGVAEAIPLENVSVDLIVSNNGLNNVQDLEKVMSECARISKPNCQFVMTMNLDKTMFEFYDQLEIILMERSMDTELKLMRQHIYEKRRPLQEMITLFERHGFIVKNVAHDMFKYQFADGTAMLNHYFIRMAFMDSWVKLLPVDTVDEIFEMLESRLNEISNRGGMKLSIPFVVINAYK